MFYIVSNFTYFSEPGNLDEDCVDGTTGNPNVQAFSSEDENDRTNDKDIHSFVPLVAQIASCVIG